MRTWTDVATMRAEQRHGRGKAGTALLLPGGRAGEQGEGLHLGMSDGVAAGE